MTDRDVKMNHKYTSKIIAIKEAWLRQLHHQRST